MNFAFLSDGQVCALGWGNAERFAEPKENAFYINDFDLTVDRPWYHFEHHLICPVSEARQLLEFLSYVPFAGEWSFSSYENFRFNFEEAQENFRAGTLKKVLLSVCDTSGQLTQKLSSLITEVPTAEYYFYGYSFEGEGAWGFSPELLFDFERNSLKTMALAGTFSNDIEERHRPEHQEVVNFFKELAQKYSMEMELKSPEISSYGKIKHLKSEIQFKNLPARSVNEWIRDFHPTPALGVSPRDRENLDFLKKLRQTVPAHFGAPFGFKSDTVCRMIVMIRGTFFDSKRAYRPIGVGVTSASSLESEWKEIALKRLAMEDLWNRLT